MAGDREPEPDPFHNPIPWAKKLKTASLLFNEGESEMQPSSNSSKENFSQEQTPFLEV